MRLAYFGLGCVFVGLGALGAFLPVLPTTPFLIVAAWAFSSSSPRLERWLLEHPRFGPRLVAWRDHRVIPFRVKLVAWASMVASLAIMTVTTRSWMVIASAGGVMLIGAVYIACKPSRLPDEVDRDPGV